MFFYLYETKDKTGCG